MAMNGRTNAETSTRRIATLLCEPVISPIDYNAREGLRARELRTRRLGRGGRFRATRAKRQDERAPNQTAANQIEQATAEAAGFVRHVTDDGGTEIAAEISCRVN